MAKYTITENNLKSLLDWKEIIKQTNCEIKPRSGTFASNEGHEDCEHVCSGNYWNGGECCYDNDTNDENGGHTLLKDLEQINQNFEWIEAVSVNHQGLRNSNNEDEFNSRKATLMTAVGQARDACTNVISFFRSTCFAEHDQPFALVKNGDKRFKNLAAGLEKYVQQINELTYQQASEFKEKLKEITDLQTPYQALKDKVNKYKNGQSNITYWKANKLNDERISIKKDMEKIFKVLDKHPALVLFDNETWRVLENSKKELFEPTKSNVFAILGKTKGDSDWILNEEDEEEIADNHEETPEQGWPWGKIALYGGGGLVVVIGLVWFIKWSKSKVN